MRRGREGGEEREGVGLEVRVRKEKGREGLDPTSLNSRIGSLQKSRDSSDSG